MMKIAILALVVLGQQKIPWETSLDKALAIARAQGKPILVHFTDTPGGSGLAQGGAGGGAAGGLGGYGYGPVCVYCEIPTPYPVVKAAEPFVCARINPNQKPYAGRFKGADLARILDPFGAELTSLDTGPKLSEALIKKAEGVAGRFAVKDVPWTEDLKKALDSGKLVAVAFVNAETENKDSWQNFFGQQVPGYPLESFVFVKAASDGADAKTFDVKNSGTILLLNPSAKDYAKSPLEKASSPPKANEFASLLYKAIVKSRASSK